MEETGTDTQVRQLFNGRDMEGWEHVGPGHFELEDGCLKSVGGMGLLWYTGETFGDCVLRVVYKTAAEDTNSGVFIRIAEPPVDEWVGVHKGYEVQILNTAKDDYHVTGAVYSLCPAQAKPWKAPGEWNVMDIRMEGEIVEVTLNGTLVTRFDPREPVPEKKMWYEPERGPRPTHGYIGVQNHDDTCTCFFREVSVRPL